MKTFRTSLPMLKHERTAHERETAFKTFTAELSTFAAGYTKKKSAILGDQDLSATGRAKKLTELNQAFRPQFDQFTARVSNIQKMYAVEAETNYRPTPFKGTGNEMLDYLKGAEVRGFLNALPLADRMKMIIDPGSDPSGIFLHALENSPVPIEGVTPDIIARAHQERAQSLNPDGVLAIEDQASVIEALTHNMSEVGKALGAAAE